jgi:hypothetical protein
MKVRCTAQMGTGIILGQIMQQLIYSMPEEKYKVKAQDIMNKLAKLKVQRGRQEQPDLVLNGMISGDSRGSGVQ